MREAQKVGRLAFVTADRAAKILKLNKEALECGVPFQIPQLASVRGQRALDSGCHQAHTPRSAYGKSGRVDSTPVVALRSAGS